MRAAAAAFVLVCLLAPSPASAADGVVVSGTVRDTDGKPVVGVPVTWKLTPAVDDGVKWRQWSETLTDAEGRYATAPLVPGSLDFGCGAELNVWEPGYTFRTETIQSTPLVRDFVLEGSLTFAGRVDAPAGASMLVWLQRRGEGPGGAYSSGAAGRRAKPAANGAFTFTALAPGVYDFGAIVEGFEKVTQRIDFAASVKDFIVAPRRGAKVTGTIASPVDTGKSYRYVRLVDEQGRECGMSDTHGEPAFAFENVPPGRWRVTVHVQGMHDDGPDGKTPSNLNGAVLFDMPSPPKEIALPRVDLVADADVGLRAVLPDGAKAMEGLVTYRSAAGAEGSERFTTSRTPDGKVGMEPVLGFMSPTAWYRADGSLRLFDMMKGRWHVTVTVPGYVTEERDVEVTGPATIDVKLVRAQGRLVASGFDGSTDYIVIEARPAGSKEPWRRILHLDRRARISDLPPPPGQVAFLAPGSWEFRSWTDRSALTTSVPVAIEDAPDAPLQLSFREDRGRSVAGRLLTRAGGHRAERLLRVFRFEEGRPVAMPEREAFAGGEGYRIRGLAPGRYRIAASDDGSVGVADFDVADEDLTLDLVLCK